MSRSFADMTNAALEYLKEMAAATRNNPDVSATYEKLSILFAEKLWHQLTVTILDVLSSSYGGDNSSGTTSTSIYNYNVLELYERVVLACDTKVNPLSLARIASLVAFSLSTVRGNHGTTTSGTPADTISTTTISGIVKGREIIQNVLEKPTVRLGSAPTLFLQSKLVLLALREITTITTNETTTTTTLLESIPSTLQEGAKLLAEEGNIDVIVYSAYYEAATAYRKIVGPPEEFYKEALLYLHYTPLDEMSTEERYTLATDLSLAAITGDGIFNFGELTTTPLLHTALHNTPNAWLMDLLQCFAQGDVITFTQVMERCTASPTILTNYPILTARSSVLQEKIMLLALVHMIFERPSSDRTLSFMDISHRTTVTPLNVELLLMRALSLGLIKGTLDQVDETVTVSWVMPRVLEPMQLKDLAARFGEWAIQVSQAKDYLVEHTPTFA